MPITVLLEGSAAASSLSSVVTADMLSGVFAEISGLLPVVIPVAIGYMALRKGIKFLFGILRQA